MAAKHGIKMGTMINSFIIILLTAAALLLAITLLQSQLAGVEPSLAGYRLCIVRSGSMAPALKVGSVVAVQPLAAEKVQPGDIITFHSGGGSLITHRIDRLETANNRLLFHTKGDANSAPDPHPVPAERLVGKVFCTLPYLGHLLAFSRTRRGLAILIALASCTALAGPLGRSVSKRKKKRKDNRPVGEVRNR
ncbi:MAG TPA: signal peptidase I [Firmicutes bacterium]|jgi:signal peptidase|nr:signal peptidase I [Bacillota bacterium]